MILNKRNITIFSFIVINVILFFSPRVYRPISGVRLRGKLPVLGLYGSITIVTSLSKGFVWSFMAVVPSQEICINM